MQTHLDEGRRNFPPSPSPFSPHSLLFLLCPFLLHLLMGFLTVCSCGTCLVICLLLLLNRRHPGLEDGFPVHIRALCFPARLPPRQAPPQSSVLRAMTQNTRPRGTLSAITDGSPDHDFWSQTCTGSQVLCGLLVGPEAFRW